MTTINYCPNCGSKLNVNAKFCSSCGTRLAVSDSSQLKQGQSKKIQFHKMRDQSRKREKVLNGKSRKQKKGLFTGLAAVVFIIALIFYINEQPSKESAIIDDQPIVSGSVVYPDVRVDHAYSLAFAKDGKIIIPLDVVKERKFVKFDYISKNTTIPLLAYLTEDGKVVTAISICEPCDSKSFHIKGSDLICNSCGTTWDLNNLDAISGSCGKYPPDPVPSKVVGNEIQIDEYLVTGWVRRV